MSSIRVDHERAAPSGAALGPADEYVEFWQAGAIARGLFCCVSCGRRLVSAHVLPSCPTCDGSLWEELATSPFATGANLAAHEDWIRDDLEETRRFLRGAVYALLVGPAIWLALGGLAYLVFELLSG